MRRDQSYFKTCLALLALMVLGSCLLSGFSQSEATLEESARAILARDCLACHGEAQTAGLDMRKRETLLKGGKRGPAVVPGKPEESILFLASAHSGELKMPPEAGPMSAADLEVLQEWINREDLWKKRTEFAHFSEAEKSFWSFQPIRDPNPPEVRVSDWSKSPLDGFILARLEEKGLSPAPPADRLTLIRRASFDLTGLPPTPEEIDAFLADESPEAFANLVDRLLDSPHYGERWAQMWLDTVRYADTAGIDNAIYRFAYRYRDYVVRAFNDDKPYNRFIIEQLAGDLLPPIRDLDLVAQQITATTFLMLGTKGTAEQDKEALIMGIVDEQIDTTSRTFLGLTVACARCHDHKFDPIPTRDYYSMAGIFRSTELLKDHEHTSMWWEYSLLQIPGQEPVHVMAPRDGKPADLRVHIRGSHRSLGEEAPRGFLQIISREESYPKIASNESGRLELAEWIASPENPLTARVMANRIWQGHFGAGLVATSSNFGSKGENPSHPELLDWLASRFIESGWSIKAMHRLILLSNTYQMQSTPRGKGLAVDPNNRFLWRMNRRRMDAEQLRDSILAISGQLDRTIGGTIFDWDYKVAAIDPERGLYFAARAGQGYESYKTQRRAMYVPVVRNQLPDMFQIFDFPSRNNSTAKRNDTTVAPQALFLMNNPFVREQSLHFAQQLLSGISEHPLIKPIYRLGLSEVTDEHRLRLAHVKVLGRPPKPEELMEATNFLSEYNRHLKSAGRSEEETQLEAWRSYCQTLFCLNEFLYIH